MRHAATCKYCGDRKQRKQPAVTVHAIHHRLSCRSEIDYRLRVAPTHATGTIS
jgi:hypothetical protein